jgi:hypothetical protein
MPQANPRTLKVTVPALLAAAGFGCFQGILDVDDADPRPGVEVEARYLREIPVRPGAALRVEGIDGTVLVRGEPGRSHLTVHAVKRVRVDDSEVANDLLDQVNVFVWETPSETVVQTVQPELLSEVNFEIDYLISVPSSTEVTVVISNGAVRVSGIASDIWVESLVGDVVLRNLEGSAWVDLGTGSIDTEMVLPPGHVLVHRVGNGGARVKVQKDVSAEFLARVATGTIDIDGLSLLRRTPSGSTIEGVLGTGDGVIHLDVGEGWVEVKGR